MEKENFAPSLRSKTWSAICHGSLAIFFVSLPSAVAIFSKNNKIWNNINEWTTNAISFAALAGGVYGWNKKQIEYLEVKTETLQTENTTLKTELSSNKSWVASEYNRHQSSNISR